MSGDRVPSPLPTPDRLPPGDLVRSRVVTDVGEALSEALDRRLDGYAVVELQDALLLDGDGAGVVGFRGGVPVGAVHAATRRAGPAALADLAAGGPARVELRAVDPGADAREDPLAAFDREAVRVAAAAPAERLAGDQALAARTRRVVDERRRVGGSGTGSNDPGGDRSADAGEAATDPVVAFLEDEAKVDAIRERARAEARERAAEWGLVEHLADED